MSLPSGSQYLDGKVLTASQPQLHLMLLEGAIRFGQKARSLWNDEGEGPVVDILLTRSIDIVEELCMGAAAGSLETSKQLEEQYAFLYREMTTARINHDLEKLDVSLRLLEFERETWKLASDKLAAEDASTSPTPTLPGMHTSMSPAGSLSFEA